MLLEKISMGPVPLSLACLILLCQQFLGKPALCCSMGPYRAGGKNGRKMETVRRGGGWDKVVVVGLDTYIIMTYCCARIGIQLCKLFISLGFRNSKPGEFR